MKGFEFRDTIESAEGDHWIPLADIMTVLMMIFLLIAVLAITRVQFGIGRVHKSLLSYSETRSELYKDLQREFHTDLPAWHATIETNLGVRFVEPDILFATGQDRIKPRFAAILKNFFPRYVRVLSQSKYRSFIDEIRIEGYSSSSWGASVPRADAYILNMALSQSRTRSTLKYIMSLPVAGRDSGWMLAHLSANGFSSSNPVRKPDGEEDAQDSQRVEFRVRTTADEQLLRIARAIRE